MGNKEINKEKIKELLSEMRLLEKTEYDSFFRELKEEEKKELTSLIVSTHIENKLLNSIDYRVSQLYDYIKDTPNGKNSMFNQSLGVKAAFFVCATLVVICFAFVFSLFI